MKTDDLAHIIKGGRSERLDWMVEGAAVETLAASLTALANTHGGMLILGVGLNNAVIGVRDAAAAIDRVLQAALTIDPALIIPVPETITLGGKTLILTHIPPGMPHVYALDGRYLVRQGAENTPLKPRDLRRLLIQRGEVSFETEIAYGASLEDIDWNKAKAYAALLPGLGEANAETALLRRGCIVRYEGRLRPTNAGLLLFGKEPQRHLRGAAITAVRFAGEAMSDSFKREDISGTLPDQIRRAETFLGDHLRKGVNIGKTMARAEAYEYPMEAARELVVNAVAHRDYSISGDEIRLFLFRDRLEVTSPGGLPGPVTIDNIKDERFSRNPVIVQVLSDMGFIERLGYGVDRVIALMRERRMQDPDFAETAGGFRVQLYNESLDPLPSSSDDEQPAVIRFDGTYQGQPINPRQEAALIHLHTNGNVRITNSDLQALCPDVHPETIRRDLADLVTKDILKKMGEKRGSYYILKSDISS
ncbi:MAG: putative DNA binding domain-containing protein [Anaerolinea sp.]|nr:putative DNA binding domain-containing protein [Anaerolinea sp.]